MNYHLVYPMSALVALTYLTLLTAFAARVTAVRRGQLKISYFKTYENSQVPEAVIKTSRHFANLFEMPVLFYAGSLAAMTMGVEGYGISFWCWLFVVARALHAYLHMGPNKILPRMASYSVGCVAIAAIWIEVVLAAGAIR